jgi:hypothetical protein
MYKKLSVSVFLVTIIGLFTFAKAAAQFPLPPDAEIMKKVTTEFFKASPDVIIKVEKGLPMPDTDLHVALFLAQQANVSVDMLFPWRKAGQSWLDIAIRLGLPPGVFFGEVPANVKVGPPYGKAYGHYKKHKKDKKIKIVLSDGEVRDLVHLKVASVYFDLPPAEIIKMRGTGKPFKEIYAGEYKKKHGKKEEKEKKNKEKKGKGWKEEKEKGKGKGHGKGVE